tara:strand:+ start:88573 stop:89466 length:894 start_codon:yes stop_codon:yes gene_type:complete
MDLWQKDGDLAEVDLSLYQLKITTLREFEMDRHIILTLGRSGSNNLVNLLNQHPEVLNVGEVIGEWNLLRKVERRLRLYDNLDSYLHAMTQSSRLVRLAIAFRNTRRFMRGRRAEIKPLKEIKTLGIKDFAPLMVRAGARNWIRNTADLKVIGLVRDDVLERFISWQMLDQTGVVLASAGTQAKTRKITLDTDRLQTLIAQVRDENLLLRDMLAELPPERVLIVRYTEFYESPTRRSEIMNDLFRFLDVEPVITESRMSKIIWGHPAEAITNREACAQALIGSEFEGILDISSYKAR